MNSSAGPWNVSPCVQTAPDHDGSGRRARVLRIHFTPDDLARTYVAPAADPMWEAALSFHWLHTRPGALVFRTWSRQVRPRVPAPTRQVLLTVNPPAGDFPDFLTPVAGVLGLRAG